MLTTDQKGSIAETEVICAAMKLGIGVYRPVTDGERYDLIFDLRPRLVRVQCKWAPLHGEVVVLRCYTSRRNCDGLVRRPYGAGELDAYAAYCPDLDRCYFVPFECLCQQGASDAASLANEEQPTPWNQLGEGLRIRG